MKLAIVSCIAALSFAALPGDAFAKDIPPQGVSVEEISAWLQAAGYRAQIQTAKDGTRNIYSSAEGSNFHIYFYDCKNAHCGTLQFSIGIDTKGALSAAKMNAWNKDNRWARAYVDNVNDPWLEYDVDLVPGGTYELLDDEFAIWRDSLSRFRKEIGQ